MTRFPTVDVDDEDLSKDHKVPITNNERIEWTDPILLTLPSSDLDRDFYSVPLTTDSPWSSILVDLESDEPADGFDPDINTSVLDLDSADESDWESPPDSPSLLTPENSLSQISPSHFHSTLDNNNCLESEIPSVSCLPGLSSAAFYDVMALSDFKSEPYEHLDLFGVDSSDNEAKCIQNNLAVGHDGQSSDRHYFQTITKNLSRSPSLVITSHPIIDPALCDPDDLVPFDFDSSYESPQLRMPSSDVLMYGSDEESEEFMPIHDAGLMRDDCDLDIFSDLGCEGHKSEEEVLRPDLNTWDFPDLMDLDEGEVVPTDFGYDVESLGGILITETLHESTYSEEILIDYYPDEGAFEGSLQEDDEENVLAVEEFTD